MGKNVSSRLLEIMRENFRRSCYYNHYNADFELYTPVIDPVKIKKFEVNQLADLKKNVEARLKNKDWNYFRMPSDFGIESTWYPVTNNSILQRMLDKNVLLDTLVDMLNCDNSVLFYKAFGEKIFEEQKIIESPSNILSPMDAQIYCKEFNDLKKYLWENYQLKPSAEIDKTEDGGGHIHISHQYIEDNDEDLFFKFTHNLIHFNANNPWLFGFLNYNDNYNAVNPLGCYKKCVRTLNPENARGSNNVGIAIRGETIEFRFFIMPSTELEAKLHFQVAQRIYDKCLLDAINDIKYKKTFKNNLEIKNLSLATCKKEFKKMCKNLDISYSDCVKTGKIKSIENRYALGREYIT